jgi:3-oxoacyl-[acyl-carrier protein] reductase
MFFIARHTAPTFPASRGRERTTTISESVMGLFYPIMMYSRTMEGIFSGRTALIIGGTGGIGRAVAVRLAGTGARLVVHGGSSRERLDRTLQAVRDAGGSGEGFLCPADLPGGAEQILARVPAPDILVCAWGPFIRRSLEELSPENWQYITANNLIFPGIMVSSVLQGMITRGWGRILLFGGTNTDTIRGFVSTAAYSAAKTALGVLAKSVARAAGAHGVCCNVVCPGLTDTEYTDETVRAYNRERSPGGQALSPEEIARFAVDILKNPRVNGALAAVDGGGFV